MPPRENIARRLAEIIGFGERGLALAREFAREGARSRRDLKSSRFFSRLPRAAQTNVLYNPAKNIAAETARGIADEVVRRLRFAGSDEPFVVVPVGSVRRGVRRRIKDLDFLVVGPRLVAPGAAAELAAAGTVEIAAVYASGERRRSLILRARRRNYRADMFFATEAEKPFALFHYTGSKLYNIRTRAVAKRHGWLLNQYGLFDAATRHRVRGSSEIRTERDLASFLGVTYHEPSDRDVS
jgi:DNA polymerase (family 10)